MMGGGEVLEVIFHQGHQRNISLAQVGAVLDRCSSAGPTLRGVNLSHGVQPHCQCCRGFLFEAFRYTLKYVGRT